MLDLRIVDALGAVDPDQLCPLALRWHLSLCAMARLILLDEMRENFGRGFPYSRAAKSRRRCQRYNAIGVGTPKAQPSTARKAGPHDNRTSSKSGNSHS